MTTYIKSLDNRAWKAILKGWRHPVIIGADNQPIGELKLEENWSKEDDELDLANSKALNAIFGGVDRNIFRLINTCEVAKDAWELLKTFHTSILKDSSRVDHTNSLLDNQPKLGFGNSQIKMDFQHL